METIGPFEIEGVLGEGGSAIVYAARRRAGAGSSGADDLNSGRTPSEDAGIGVDAGGAGSDAAPTVARAEELALKVLRPELMLSDREVGAFLAEAHRAQRVRHASLVEIREAGLLPDGRPYLAMPRLRGECLAERVKRGPFGVDAGLRLFRGIAEAIEVLHAAGLVHRDIKPENVFVIGAEERLVLLDLGIAREMDAPASTTTQAGLVRGTPAYMAPERFFGARASALTDTYEATVLLYVMLTGRLPWAHAQDAMGRMSPRDPRTVAALAEPVAAAILRGLSVDERARPRSVRELLEELEHAAISTADTTVAPVLGGVTPPAPTLPSPGAARGRPAAVIALSAPPPPGDIATQDTVAISTGRGRRGGPSWVPAVFAACVLAGAAAGVAAFVVPRGGDAGAGASASAGAGAANAGAMASAGAAARPGDVGAGSATGDAIGSEAPANAGSGEPASSAAGAPGGAIGDDAAGAGAQPATSAARDASGGMDPAAAAGAGAASAVAGAGSANTKSTSAGSMNAGSTSAGSANTGSASAGSANTKSASAGSTNAGSASGGSSDAGSTSAGSASGAASSSSAASAAPSTVAGAHLADCMSLLALYCSPQFKATDGGTTCSQWSVTIHGYRSKPQELWAHFNEGCKMAHRGGVLALAERQRQIAAGKAPGGAPPKTP